MSSGSGLVWGVRGHPGVAFATSFGADSVVGIELIADSGRLERLDAVVRPT